jgi:hypothetical protein
MAMRRLWLGLAVVAMMAAAGVAQARDLTYSNILGTWCGDTTDYKFTRGSLTITWHSGKFEKRVWAIKKYEFSEEWINVFWEDHGNTVFADFADDGTMAQQPNTSGDKGPRRPFHRC